MVGDLGEWLGWGFATWAITYIIAWAQFEKGKLDHYNLMRSTFYLPTQIIFCSQETNKVIL